jgi:hypothetical protein
MGTVAKLEIAWDFQSANNLGQQLNPGSAGEDRVVRDERDGPADRRGCDPEVGVVVALMQRMTDRPALVA